MVIICIAGVFSNSHANSSASVKGSQSVNEGVNDVNDLPFSLQDSKRGVEERDKEGGVGGEAEQRREEGK